MARTIKGTVEFRGNPPRWFARVTVRDEHGNTHRPWVDLERPDLPNTAEGKEVAQRLAKKRAKIAAKGRYVGRERATAPRVTLSSLEDRWFALLDADAHVKPGTRQAYKSCFTSRIMPAFGKVAIVDLKVPALRAWIRELCDELSPSTVRNCAVALTRFLSDARAEGWVTLETNPMKHEDVRAVLPTVEAPDPESIVQWTRTECETLLALPTLPDDRFGLYLVALLTGLRAGELHGLTFGHIETDATVPHLRIRQQTTLARAAGETTATGTPKTRSSKRDVPLHPSAVTWLAWWRDEGWALRFGRPRNDGDHVFPAIDGAAGRPRDANILRRDLTAAKLPVEFTTPEGTRIPFTFHVTRRTFSRLLGDAGVSVETVSMLAGHAGGTVTERHYMGRSIEAMARAVAMIKIALPARAGVSFRPEELSYELSRPETVQTTHAEKALLDRVVTYEQPIELPQFRHSRGAASVDTHETPKNIDDGARSSASATLANGNVLQLMKPLENRVGTLRDVPSATENDSHLRSSELLQADPVETALAAALSRATDDGTVAAIVAELAARRRARS